MEKMKKIRELLSDRNGSEVARRIGITPTYLSYIRNGQRTPSSELQTKLLNYLEGNHNENK